MMHIIIIIIIRPHHSTTYVRPLSVKCPYLKNYGALMYKSPLGLCKVYPALIWVVSEGSVKIVNWSIWQCFAKHCHV